MKRTGLFLALTLGALAALILTVLWYLAAYQSGGVGPRGFMGQMMGGQYGYGTALAMPTYVWLAVAGLVVLLAAGAAGLAYSVALPEIRTQPTGSDLPGKPHGGADAQPVDWSVLIKTSKPEERKVLEVLAAHGGSYLQKFIVKEAGLSRLKTHRIVSRYAERGVLLVSKSGNTNEVSLAPWLKQDSAST